MRLFKKPSTPAYGSFVADAATLRAEVADKALVQTGDAEGGGRQVAILGVGPNHTGGDAWY